MKSTLSTDKQYQQALRKILDEGEVVASRNGATIRHPCISFEFDSLPLVTMRQTAIKSALRDIEWIMSGESEVPARLLKWWQGQICADGHLYRGYGQQLRESLGYSPEGEILKFDQIKFLLNELQKNPLSRRLLLTTWSPYEMAHITDINQNPRTPANCFLTTVQFFVSHGRLSAFAYQRSGDMMLGVPHDFLEVWAVMTYLAEYSGLSMGRLNYTIGDAHIYYDDNHIEAANKIIDIPLYKVPNYKTMWTLNRTKEKDKYGQPKFQAKDFVLPETIPAPIVVQSMEVF